MLYIGVSVILLVVLGQEAGALIYDYYSGEVVSPEYVLRYAHSEAFRQCTVSVEACSASEPRRVDGTCSYPRKPSYGGQRTPFKRLLPPLYGSNNTVVRVSNIGKPLPSAREVRTALQKDFRVVSNRFNMAFLHIGGFFALETVRIDSVGNYLFQKTDCCTRAAVGDPKCIPILVPKDDPYLRGSGITCLNLTRTTTFQELGCIDNDQPAEQVNHQTPLVDLSAVYGPNETVANRLRTYENGFLRMEFRRKRYVNPSGSSFCAANKKGWPCYSTGDDNVNFQPKLTLFSIFFSRLHNMLAAQLALVNPCWHDEKLYQTARSINIAIEQNILLYEFSTAVLGAENLERRGLLSSGGLEKTYNPKLAPQTLAEYEVGLRALHALVDDAFGLYNKKGEVVAVTSLNRWFFAVGILEQDDNMETMSRSLFFQPSAESLSHSDPSMSENMFRTHQKAHDLFSIDIQRGRDFGLRTYNEYRHYCGLAVARSFEDLSADIDKEKINALHKLYHHVDAIELYAGAISERPMPGSVVGPTLFCIMAEQIHIFKAADRFWFENKGGKHGLTTEQLLEVRGSSMARVACDTVDGLKKVQPRAFYLVSPENPVVPCEKIPAMDLSKWRDDNCDVTPQGRNFG